MDTAKDNKIAEQAAEIDRLGLVLAERQAKIGELMGEAARAGIAGAPASVPSDMRDAYVGAREDLLDWKNRALRAEESCRRLTAAINTENGPTHMGEPVSVPQLRKATSELTLKELAAEFAAVAELGCDYTISAGDCKKLFEAMTTPPTNKLEDSKFIAEAAKAGVFCTMPQAVAFGRKIESATRALAAVAPLPELTGPSEALVYVECRECSCGHVGINDASETLAACHNCDWSGPSPVADHCPGCADGGCMGAACPKCGAIYKLLAETNITLAASPSLAPARQTCVCGEPTTQGTTHRTDGPCYVTEAAPAPQQEPIIFGIDYSGDYLAEVRDKALEEAAVVVLQGPFAGTRTGDAAAIRALKSSESVETAAPGASQPMQILSDVEVMRLRDVGAAWMSQDGRDALDDWLLGVQSPPVAGASIGDKQ